MIAITASLIPVTASKVIVITEDLKKSCIFSYSDPNVSYYRGKKLSKTGKALGNNNIYHGSSKEFQSFKGKDHFFTSDVETALGFSSLSSYFSGVADNTLYTVELQGNVLTIPKLKVGSRYIVDIKGKKSKSGYMLTDKGPHDEGLKKFVKESAYDIVHFEGVWDAGDGIVEIWYCLKKDKVKILNKWKVFFMSPDYPIPANGTPKVISYVNTFGTGYDYKPVTRKKKKT